MGADSIEPLAILVGCVSKKLTQPAPAKDLYASDVWAKRRAYAEESGRPWLILSALHGLVDPDEMLAPYDLALKDRPARERRAWGKQVVTALDRRFGTLASHVFEIHAGSAYREALEPELATRGAALTCPVEGLRFGEQLAWYAERRRPRRF